MDALELLLTRRSQPRLQAPAPSEKVLENIMQAALRVPDHMGLTPWRFVVCHKAGLKRLGDIFEQAAIIEDKGEKHIERASQLPHRAPMVIVAIAKYKEHEKVPWIEQVASASCAVSAMQMAALAQGYAGVWRTGSYAQSEVVKHAFELGEQDEIVGFLYLGSTVLKTVAKSLKSSKEYFEVWS
ncbi:MAG: nitroreductase [Paraglaciecola sp.]|jgi:nitroreductase